MEPWVETTITIMILAGMVLAWLSTIIPVFPGPTVMWVLATIYWLATGLPLEGALFFVPISVLVIAALLADNVLMVGGARKKGARWSSIGVAFLAGFVGSLLLAPIAGIFTPLLSLFIVPLVIYLLEYRRHKDTQQAWEAFKAIFIGWGWATLVRVVLGFFILVVWGAWVLIL